MVTPGVAAAAAAVADSATGRRAVSDVQSPSSARGGPNSSVGTSSSGLNRMAPARSKAVASSGSSDSTTARHRGCRKCSMRNWLTPRRSQSSQAVSGAGGAVGSRSTTVTAWPSLARRWAMYGSLCPGTPTRMLVGLLMKLNALDTISPSAPTTTPVVGPSALRKIGPFGLVTTMSVPPSVVICTTLGETFLTASFMARSSLSLRSSWPRALFATKRAAAMQSKRMTCPRSNRSCQQSAISPQSPTLLKADS